MRGHRVAAVFLAVALSGAGLAAERATLKLATLAPDGSIWHKVLKDMAAEWQERTGGRREIVIYAGGVAGDDPAIVRKIRTGRLQAGAVTISGLAELDPAFSALAIPLFFDSDAEFIHVREQLTPTLARRVEERGFVLLQWGHGGWIQLFSKKPVRTVEDMKQVKMFTWAGDDSMTQAWKSNGFRPVPLAATDILTGLQTGMIEALPTTPLAALAMQWYRHTPYLVEPGVAPLVAATVVERKAWEAIPEADRRLLREIARKAEERLNREIPQKDREAVEEMAKRGLTVIRVDAGERSWREVARAMSERMEASVPQDILEQAKRFREAFRQRTPGKGE